MTITLKAGTPLRDGSTLLLDVTLELPRLKFGVMGRPGSGKSHFIATLPKPLLVLGADIEEKMQPYFDRCASITRSTGQYGQKVLVGTSPTTGKPIIQMEIFADDEPTSPKAFNSVLARAEQLRGEVNAGAWASVALDPWSQFETLATWRRKYGPMAVPEFEAYGRGQKAVADDLKLLVMARLVTLECNVGLAFHTMEKPRDEGGVSFFGIKAVTKELPTDLASLVPERYRSETLGSTKLRRLWTQPDGRYDLCTLHDAPSPCDNDYKALFANFIEKRAAAANAAAKAGAAQAPREGETK